MLYKAILQHDRWGADLHTEISKSWHVNQNLIMSKILV